MTPTASSHAIVISPGTKLLSVPNSDVGMTYSGEVASLPKYAIGLFDSNGSGPRKRKRLTHLTPEEKVMRRKLKNRVAAQTARDRKRLKMECLEETVQKVQQQAKELLDVNMKLLERAEALERENAQLRCKLGLHIDENPIVSGNRREFERIKIEFDDTLNANAQSLVPEGILSPDESSDETDGSFGSLSNDGTFLKGVTSGCQKTLERVSPEPAAGCCQILVDPLQSRNDKYSSSNPEENCYSDDILGILERIGTNVESSQPSVNTSEGIGFDHTSIIQSPVTEEQINSIKDLINVDHIYSKPNTHNSLTAERRPAFKLQLSSSVPSTKLIKQPASSMIKVNLPVKQENKPIALIEDSTQKRKQTVQSKTRVTKLDQNCDNFSPTHPLLCDVRMVVDNKSIDSDSYLANFDAELDNILNDRTASDNLPLVSPLDLDFFSIPDSDSSMEDSFSSKLPENIETPLVSDILNPFEYIFKEKESIFTDNLTAELFPQLAAVI